MADKLRKASSSGVASQALVAATRTAGATTLSIKTGGLTRWNTETSVDFTTYRLDSNGNVTSKTDWTGKANPDTNTISELEVTSGTDTGNLTDDIVVCLETAAWVNDLISTLFSIFNYSGSLKSDIIGALNLINGCVSTTKIADSAVIPSKLGLTTLSDGSTNGVIGNITAVERNNSGVAMGYGLQAVFRRRGNIVFLNINSVTTGIPVGNSGITETVPSGFRPAFPASLPAIMVDGGNTTGNVLWDINVDGSMSILNRSPQSGNTRLVGTITYFTNDPMPA